MTIATDRTGENIAFGITVPIITPLTPHDEIRSRCDTIAQRLMAQLDASEDDDQMSLPIPVSPTPDCTFSEVQETALVSALAMTRSLRTIGYTVLSCTPAAMADTRHTSDPQINTGYVLVATPTANVDELLATYESHPVPTLWTEYANSTYGQAAVNRAMDEMQNRLHEMMADNGQSVH